MAKVLTGLQLDKTKDHIEFVSVAQVPRKSKTEVKARFRTRSEEEKRGEKEAINSNEVWVRILT
jgi:hypothetical protein